MNKLLPFINQFRLFNISGRSMLPVLSDGDVVITTSRIDFYQRGSIIVFTHNINKEILFVKRIIGLPTEIFNYNGSFKNIRIHPDEIFVLGDNQLDSFDSRKYGPIKMDQVLAKIIFRVWPLHKFGLIK